ncbi:PQQ-like beta-propeller repeat protein [Candidatus Cytomitobacter primus]|uniref:PQQ-like beta-propeller repeat protein n=1 Tax=Candidatus Cytomitobacter primus TaxID=2066024 RepID=A0A5C0UG83_9PROT|nr:PQQ-like beta-propeller repeat protein [Candidatus Cytomitobacter primus]
MFLLGCDGSDIKWKKTSSSYVQFEQITKNIPWKKHFVPEIDFDYQNVIVYRNGKAYLNDGSNQINGSGDKNQINNGSKVANKAISTNGVANSISSKNLINKDFKFHGTELSLKKIGKHTYMIGDLSNHFYIIDTYNNRSNVVYKGSLNSPLAYCAKINDKVIVASTTGHFKAFKVIDSKFEILWEKVKMTNNHIGIKNSIILKNNKIIYLSSNGDITAIDIFNGEDIWSHMTSQTVESFDFSDDNNHIITRVNQKVIVLDMSGNVKSECDVLGLKKVLASNGFVYLVVNNEIMISDMNNIKNSKYFVKHKYDGDLFINKGMLFSLNNNGELFAYTEKKGMIYNFNKNDLHIVIKNINRLNMNHLYYT